jgi:hypothetical protein
MVGIVDARRGVRLRCRRWTGCARARCEGAASLDHPTLVHRDGGRLARVVAGPSVRIGAEVVNANETVGFMN